MNKTIAGLNRMKLIFGLHFKPYRRPFIQLVLDSLRAIAEPVDKTHTLWERITFQKKRSRVAKSVAWYRYLALFFMLIMLSLQIYGIIGPPLWLRLLQLMTG